MSVKNARFFILLKKFQQNKIIQIIRIHIALIIILIIKMTKQQLFHCIRAVCRPLPKLLIGMGIPSIIVTSMPIIINAPESPLFRFYCISRFIYI